MLCCQTSIRSPLSTEKAPGALRAAVQQHLRQHKNIRTFRLGVFGEGEAGVTIAELK